MAAARVTDFLVQYSASVSNYVPRHEAEVREPSVLSSSMRNVLQTCVVPLTLNSSLSSRELDTIVRPQFGEEVGDSKIAKDKFCSGRVKRTF
ncbi:hypothetical protein CHS0354_009408 [Potamilus streckersoni]|uniref:Uncharacterized protein n=1 Tax=Potamilus streckersoni TaxID=2493646 RepID=A0AAE0T428_9BIVA|nr:hypothetical protein CHS0354_009408 [Potamilus streckersoni]